MYLSGHVRLPHATSSGAHIEIYHPSELAVTTPRLPTTTPHHHGAHITDRYHRLPPQRGLLGTPDLHGDHTRWGSLRSVLKRRQAGPNGRLDRRGQGWARWSRGEATVQPELQRYVLLPRAPATRLPDAHLTRCGEGLWLTREQINRSTVPAPRRSLPSNSPKTNRLSPSSATPATRPRPALGEGGLSREGGASVVDEGMPEAAEANSNALEDGVGNKATTTTINAEGVEGRAAAGGSAGRTTTSRSATAMRRSTSSLIGRCWRRSTLTAWPS